MLLNQKIIHSKPRNCSGVEESSLFPHFSGSIKMLKRAGSRVGRKQSQ
jgi:hypothetical protein